MFRFAVCRYASSYVGTTGEVPPYLAERLWIRNWDVLLTAALGVVRSVCGLLCVSHPQVSEGGDGDLRQPVVRDARRVHGRRRGGCAAHGDYSHCRYGGGTRVGSREVSVVLVVVGRDFDIVYFDDEHGDDDDDGDRMMVGYGWMMVG